MGIYIVIPAYNEEGRITKTLSDYGRLIGKVEGLRIIVVSESTDGTDGIVRKHAERHKEISLIPGKTKRGKGGAVMDGVKMALKGAKGSDIIGFIDADDAVTSSQFMRLVRAIRGYDCVIGSRYLDGSRIVGRITARRFIASRVYNALVRLLFGMHYRDTQCGAKIFRADALRGIVRRIEVDGLGFDVNMLYELELQGRRIREYPIEYFVKNTGRSVTVGQVLKMFVSTIWYRMDRGGRRWISK